MVSSQSVCSDLEMSLRGLVWDLARTSERQERDSRISQQGYRHGFLDGLSMANNMAASDLLAILNEG